MLKGKDEHKKERNGRYRKKQMERSLNGKLQYLNEKLTE